MKGVFLNRRLEGLTGAQLYAHMERMQELWESWGRPTAENMPDRFAGEVMRVRAELARRGEQRSLF
jgi:hypothetical protein